MKSKCYRITVFTSNDRRFLEFYYFLKPNTNSQENTGLSDIQFVKMMFTHLGDDVRVYPLEPTGKVTFYTNGSPQMSINIGEHIV